MRRIIAILIVSTSSAQDAPPPPQGAAFAASLAPQVREFTPAMAAGLPEGIKPIPIGWDAAYRVALTRGARDAKAAIPAKPEPLSAEEFANLRAALQLNEKAENNKLHDPTPVMLDLLLKLQRSMSSRIRVAGLAQMFRLFSEYVKGGATSGVTDSDVDHLATQLMDARRDMSARSAEYRDSLNDLKGLLALPPNTPLVADRLALGGFHDVFGELNRWAAKEDNDYAELPGIINGLPKRPDLMIDGQSLVDVANRSPDLGGSLIASATKQVKDDPTAFRARKRLRRLAMIGMSYEFERTKLLILTKARDAFAQRLVAPPNAIEIPSNQATRTMAFAKSIQDQFDCEDRLVEAWAEGHTLRHALMIDLGILPQTRDEFMGSLATTRLIPPKK